MGQPKGATYWKSLVRGDFITLSDIQTIRELQSRKVEFAEKGADFEIVRTPRKITSSDGQFWIVLYDIVFRDLKWILVVMGSGEDYDLKAYWVPDDIPSGSREDMLNRNMFWVFEEPKDLNNFKPNDLVFTKSITETIDGATVVFERQANWYGTCVEGSNQTFATVIEFKADPTKTENPYYLFLEFNSISTQQTTAVEDRGRFETTTVQKDKMVNTEGSFIVILLGCVLSENDVQGSR